MGVSDKMRIRPDLETDRRDRELKDATIYAMVVAGRQSPAQVAEQFKLTIGDVRRIVRRVRQRAGKGG
jgi:hypothetical protein